MRVRLLMRPPGESFETLTLLYAVATVLVVRLFLELAGYPQIGDETLHIAHVLWGGLLMLVAGRLSLSFYGEGIRRTSAILLGIGFGLFVDEIGKFITQDNDYFFRPAVALIYASFVLLFLASRALRRLHPPTDRALLCSALEHMTEVVREDFEPHEKDVALASLDRVIASGSTYRPLAAQLRDVLAREEPHTRPERHPLARTALTLAERIRSSARYRRWLMRLLVAAALVGLAKTAAQALLVLATVAGADLPAVGPMSRWRVPESDFTAFVLQAAASIVAGVFLLRGLWELPRHARRGLYWLGRGFTVSVLVVDVFTFYFSPLGATLDVLVNLLFLGVIQQLDTENLPGPGRPPDQAEDGWLARELAIGLTRPPGPGGRAPR